MTYRDVLSDCLSLLKQTYQNKEFEDNHVFFWILMYANRLRSQHDSKIRSGSYIHRFIQVPINTENITGCKYISLPEDIFDLDRDGGIEYVTYDYSVGDCIPTIAHVEFHRTSVTTMKTLYYTEEETPRPDSPYFYRIKNNLYLLGIECIPVQYLEIGLRSSMNLDTSCDLDSEFEFPSELYPILQNYVLNVGKFGLMIPEDSINKGENRVSPENISIPRTGVQTQPIQQVSSNVEL